MRNSVRNVNLYACIKMVFGFSFLTSDLFFKTLLIHFRGISSILKSKNLFMISDVQLRASCLL